MDGFEVKTCFIGFKAEPRLKECLIDVARKKELTLSKLIHRILLDYCRREVRHE